MLKLLENAIPSVDKFLERKANSTQRRTEAETQAIDAVLAAITTTEAYLYECRRGRKKSRKRERELSTAWRKAAVAVRHVDRRLSRIASVKSFGWANPELWNHPKYRNLPTQLTVIREQYEWLLDENSSV